MKLNEKVAISDVTRNSAQEDFTCYKIVGYILPISDDEKEYFCGTLMENSAIERAHSSSAFHFIWSTLYSMSE
jgi:hypothetical protein